MGYTLGGTGKPERRFRIPLLVPEELTLRSLILFTLPFVLPGALLGGTLNLTGSSASVTTQGVAVYSGNLSFGDCVPGGCFVEGTFNLGPSSITWYLDSPWGAGPNYTYDGLGPPDFTLAGDGGTFSIAENNLAGGTVSGTFVLTSLTETGDYSSMTLGGTANITAFSATPGDPFATALADAGITSNGQTLGLSVSVTGCQVGGQTTTCVQNVDPTGAVSSVSVTSGVPEPGTFGLLAIGIVGAVWKRFPRPFSPK